MNYKYITPTDMEIIGSLDDCPCRAEINSFDENGEPEWSGETEMFYDEQKTRERDGKPIYVDENGDEWTLDECRRVEITEDDE